MFSTKLLKVHSGLVLMRRSFLPVAESHVYERIFDVFFQIKNVSFENYSVADSQVHERIVEVIFNAFMQIKK